MQKIQEEEEEFRAKHVFPIPRRALSSIDLHSKYTDCKILQEPDSADAFVMYMHPTKSYQKFVQEHAADDFATVRAIADGDEDKYKFLRKQKCKKAKKRMRVRSQGKSYT